MVYSLLLGFKLSTLGVTRGNSSLILVGTCHFDPHKYQNYPLKKKKKKERKKERKKKRKRKRKRKKKFEPTFILAQILKILPTFPEKKVLFICQSVRFWGENFRENCEISHFKVEKPSEMGHILVKNIFRISRGSYFTKIARKL